MLDVLILKLTRRGARRETLLPLLDLPGRERLHPADQDLVREGMKPSSCSVLLDGLAARYRLLSSGRRQITSLIVPGDLADFGAMFVGRLDYGVMTITPCQVGTVDHESLRRTIIAHPQIALALWQDTLIEGAIHREWIVSMGRRSAKGQMAHLLCEVLARLRAVDRNQDASFHFPLTQSELADVLGLSPVHVNRILKELRRDGLIAWNGQHLEVLNGERLAEIAEFSDGYLGLDGAALALHMLSVDRMPVLPAKALDGEDHP